MKLNVFFLTLALAAPAFAGSEPTAFQLAREGNRFVGEPSKGKVLEISSDKSIAGITPSIWRVAYFDPDARSRVVEVKFGSGLKMEVNRPWKVFTSGGKEERVLDLKKFKVDSDEALKIATTQKLLQPFTLKYSQLWLQRNDDGLTWKVRLWAAKLGKSDVIVEIGDLFLSPEDGQVVRADLHIDRLN
ncbi:MAG: hypothetical protein WCH99_19065 [Verrucomicrobiota bacterium]